MPSMSKRISALKADVWDFSPAMPYAPIFKGKSEPLRLNNPVFWERSLEITET